MIIATKDEGTALLIFGKMSTIAIVNNVSPAIIYSILPLIHPLTPSCTILNWAT